jgi:parallel beta-helix repeat protein
MKFVQLNATIPAVEPRRGDAARSGRVTSMLRSKRPLRAVVVVGMPVIAWSLVLAGTVPAEAVARNDGVSSVQVPDILVVDDADDSPGCDDAQFSTIGAAVAVADPGDVVEVCPGRYEERLIVDKPLTIRANTEAFDSVEAVDCFAAGPFVADPTRHAIVSATDTLAAPWLDLQADNVDVRGLVFQGTGHVIGRRPLTSAMATSPDHSGYRLQHNVIVGHDVGVFLRSNGTLASAFAHSCLRENGWGLANDGLPLIDARIHDNSSSRTRNYTFELTQGTQEVMLDHNRSQAELSAGGTYLFRLTTSTTAYDNSAEAVRFGIRLLGGNTGLQLISNHLAVTQGGIVSPTRLGGVQLPSNLGVVIRENTVLGTGTTPVGTGPWSGIGMGGGALKNSSIVENVVRDHYGEGIALLENNTGNDVSENVVSNNGSFGIRIAAGATGNTLVENRILNNAILGPLAPMVPSPPADSGAVDAYDGARAFNVWRENVCGSDFPAGTICGVE